MKIIGLYTQEANMEAERIINSPVNIIDGQLNASRGIGNEAINTFYSMTL